MADCFLSGVGDQYRCKGIKKPIDGENLAPWVRVRIEGKGVDITVGNQSDPDHENHAVIKSFQFGTSSGATTTLEILDEEGGNFESFMCGLNKDVKQANNDYRMKVKFGWTNSSCDGGGGSMPESADFYFVPKEVKANYAEGKIRFTVTGTPLMEILWEVRQGTAYGKEPNDLIPIKEAIRRMFSDGDPKVNTIKYLRVGPDGQPVEWKFKTSDGSNEGPKGVWQAHTQNKLDVAYRWLSSYRTDKDKGITATWDPEESGGCVVFWEDPVPSPQETIDWCSRSLGTYLVNGGSCSSVISFNPSASWAYGALQRNSGGTGGPGTGATVPNEGRIDDPDLGEDEFTGTATFIPSAFNTWNNYGPENANKEISLSMAANQAANKRIHAMEAELRVQGDPKLAGQMSTKGRVVSIIVVNPFHLMGGGSGCGDWLAKPPVNPVYSNKAWMIDGVDHFIKEGQYVTTLKLMLGAPGSDIDPDAVFGGEGSGGWSPKSSCSG